MAPESYSVKSSLILSTFSTLLFLSMFYRVSNAMIAPRLVQDLGLNAETLGIFMGFFSSVGMLAFSHIKELFPVAISGTVIAWVNFFSTAGAAIFMPTLGKVIQTFHHPDHSYPAEAYHLSFFICFCV